MQGWKLNTFGMTGRKNLVNKDGQVQQKRAIPRGGISSRIVFIVSVLVVRLVYLINYEGLLDKPSKGYL